MSEADVEYIMHVGICVSDLERAVRFYGEGLGFEEALRFDIEGAPTTTLLSLDDVCLHAVYMQREGFRIELLDYERPGPVGDGEARPMNGLGLTHFAVRVADLDSTIERLESLGGKLLESTRVENPEYESRVVYVTDPDGTRFELAEMPADPTR